MIMLNIAEIFLPGLAQWTLRKLLGDGKPGLSLALVGGIYNIQALSAELELGKRPHSARAYCQSC